LAFSPKAIPTDFSGDSLGATRIHIRNQFLAESLMLVALGGLVGVALGALVTVVYAASQGWTVTVPPEAIVGGVAASLGWRPPRRCAPPRSGN
jgi:hypothetical protein